ncbi:GGDEF domain-containing protein [Litchfieldia alkalitelluris]|uniref:GGDEF domain-containing protein n=1 Tax=Litchfieldia alkalitelluris TaxID=304268 RepID=UPI001475FA2B|nr:GGDEF domain-containing protein [Litchfieldia alkalitelluris]
MKVTLNKFQEFKLRIYLWMLPVLILALLVNLMNWSSIDQFNQITSSLLVIWYITAFVLLYNKRFFRFVELFNLLIISILHLMKSFDIIYGDMVLNQELTTGNATLWTPLVFVYIFVTLNARVGSVFSIILWSITLAMGVIFWDSVPDEATNAILQYHLSNLVYIGFLFFARNIIKTYTESEFLEKLAFQDYLTGIGNRRMVYSWVETLIEARTNTSFSIIFFDIDHFKKINDNFGHVTGDNILKDLSNLVTQHIPKVAKFGRWGGEEFVIILPGYSKEKAAIVAEEIRRNIEHYTFPVAGGVTTSFGVESYQPSDTAESLLDRADQALYEAKGFGRNQVRIYQQNN